MVEDLLLKEQLKPYIREILRELVSEKEKEFEDLKMAITPGALKKEFTRILQESYNDIVIRIKEDIIKQLESKYINKFDKQINDLIFYKINEEVIKNKIEEVINYHLESNFKDIAKKSVEIAQISMFKKTNKILRSISNLKTSTIQNITANLPNPTKEKEILNELSKDFPEYFLAIENDVKNLRLLNN